MAKRLISYILLIIMAVSSYAAEKKYVLVIDAGHGGHDAGAIGSFSKEKNINLNVALAFGKYVERYCNDVKVIYTRKTDVFIPLHERADIANKNHADVFISIHTNALPQGRIARGLETYTMGMRRSSEKLSAAQRENSVITVEKDYKERYAGYDPNSPESTIMFEFINDKNMAKSVELAKLVQRNVCSTAGRQDKGVKQDVFLVLRETSMPACLIELGFISTPDEERLLNDATVIDNIAKGIYQAFVKYKGDEPVNIPNTKQETVSTKVVAEPITEEKTRIASTQPKKKENKNVTGKPDVKPEARLEKTNGGKSEKKEIAVKEKKVEAELIIKEQKSDKLVKKETKTETTAEAKTETAKQDNSSTPTFKVQILVSDKALKSTDARFKGHKADSYTEGGMTKYTIGNTSDYAEVSNLRKELQETFPDCFVVAFRGDDKMNLTEAINEYKSRKKK